MPCWADEASALGIPPDNQQCWCSAPHTVNRHSHCAVHVTGEASHEASATSSLASSPTKASIKGAHAGGFLSLGPLVDLLLTAGQTSDDRYCLWREDHKHNTMPSTYVPHLKTLLNLLLWYSHGDGSKGCPH